MKWVKQDISKKEWENYYSKNSSYCSIDGGGSVGFLAVDIKDGCEACDIHDLRQIDTYRRSANIRPFPLEEEKINQEDFKSYEDREEVKKELAKLKGELKNILNFKN